MDKNKTENETEHRKHRFPPYFSFVETRTERPVGTKNDKQKQLQRTLHGNAQMSSFPGMRCSFMQLCYRNRVASSRWRRANARPVVVVTPAAAEVAGSKTRKAQTMGWKGTP